MSISKLTASLLSGQNENNLSLAHVNFDFALLKVSPPPEYNGLGSLLSSSRRKEAEDGNLHKTARKLSALFQPLLPKTPTLLKVYGSRVSEISEVMNATHKSGSRLSAMFAEWVGIDATSLWASATSGPAAISVHLLACMIARSFTVSEAISIWYELVERRKEQITKSESEGLADVPEIIAGRCSFDRAHLAEWDASARAWLRSADQAMSEKQTRLMRALESLNLSVGSQDTVLDSVMQACNSALEAMERLVCGTPLRIQSPAVLCGLLCWHVYPDVLVLGAGENEPIRQDDPLVAPGGLLTVGMRLEENTDESIFWSLPLSYLRWYGDPVMVRGHIGLSHSRVTPQEFVFITLGSLFGSWGPDASVDEISASWITLIFDLFKNSTPSQSEQCRATDRRSWLYLLNQAAHTFLKSEAEERHEYRRAILFGRRSQHFLPRSDSSLRRSTPQAVDGDPLEDDKARYSLINGTWMHLSWQLPMFGLSNLHIFTRLLPSDESRLDFFRRVAISKNFDARIYFVFYRPTVSSGKGDPFLFATIAPVEAPTSRKRDHEGNEKIIYSHAKICWIPGDYGILQYSHGREPGDDYAEQHFTVPTEIFSEANTSVVYRGFRSGIIRLNKHALERGRFIPSSRDDDDASIPSTLFPTEMLRLLKGCTLNRIELAEYLTPSRGPLHLCLTTVAAIHLIYKLLPGATISARTVQRPLPTFKFRGPFFEDQISSAAAFAAVAYCDSGHALIPINSNIFAISTGNSIFVHGQLLSDPHENVMEYELRQLHGNISKPGVTLLVGPINPRIRRTQDTNWRVVNHFTFDGTESDSFRDTSLHLSFTDWMVPVSFGSTGNRDPEAFIVESVISIHDKGKWVADVDIKRAIEQRIHWRTICNKRVSNSCPAEDDTVRKPMLMYTAIDCWEELLEPPNNHMVARTQGNWIGRLALTSLAVRMGFTVVVLPRDSCSKCLERLVFDRSPNVDEFGNHRSWLMVIM